MEDREDRETRRLEYFASLPAALTDREETLRAALLEVAARLGNVRLSLVAQDPSVKDAKVALDMPKGVGLGQWIQQRIPEDFTLLTPESSCGEPMLIAAGSDMGADAHQASAEADQAIEDFYMGLPTDEFLPEELTLREKILDALSSAGGSAKLSTLTRGEYSKDVHFARAAVLPKGAPLLGWIERRMGSEVRVSQDDRGANVAELIGEAAASVGRRGKGSGKDKGKDKGAGKGAGADRKVFRPAGVEDTPEARMAAAEEAKAAREARMQEFLDTLPKNRLLPEEQRFRELILSELHAAGGEMRLSMICQKPEAKAAKGRLLPPETSVGAWIEHRIGAEVLIHRDAQNNSFAMLAAGAPRSARPAVPAIYGGNGAPVMSAEPPTAKDERDLAMQEYFARLGALQPLERRMRDLLVEAAQRAGSAGSRVSDLLNGNPAMQQAWQALKQKFMQASPPVEASFARWIELRLVDELKFTREPWVQLRGGMKRSAPGGSPYASDPKAPRTGGRPAPFRPIGAK